MKKSRLNGRHFAISFLLVLFLAVFPFTACQQEGEPQKLRVETPEQDLRDKDITDAVQNDLLMSPSVPSHLIDVQTENGIVILSGSVDSLLAEDRAITIAESIKGVRSVVDKIEVVPVYREDQEIQRDLERAFILDPVAEKYEIDVQVSGGTAYLRGTVDSWAEKRLAAQVAKGVKGIKNIANEIEVEYAVSRPDTEIKADIERQLKIDPYVDHEFIDVRVTEGMVQLSGTVGSAAEKRRATYKSWVAGATTVDDSGLEIEWWAEEPMERAKPAVLTDQEIKEAVNDALLYDPRVSSFVIDVEVDNGLVTLSGTVDNLKSKHSAAQDARNTTGVWKVENNIKVRPAGPPSDFEITQNVKNALLWNPMVDRFDITVAARNKRVYLYGSVDSRYEKCVAEDVASRVKGVVEVDNNLTVEDTWEWRSDTEIERSIEKEFFWSVVVDGSDITVSVEDGVATLTGVVEDVHELDAAVKNAFDGGARTVRNHLVVEGREGEFPEFYHRSYLFWPYYGPAWYY